jgi:hypothetical protein
MMLRKARETPNALWGDEPSLLFLNTISIAPDMPIITPITFLGEIGSFSNSADNNNTMIGIKFAINDHVTDEVNLMPKEKVIFEITNPNNPPAKMISKSRRDTFSLWLKRLIIQNTAQLKASRVTVSPIGDIQAESNDLLTTMFNPIIV